MGKQRAGLMLIALLLLLILGWWRLVMVTPLPTESTSAAVIASSTRATTTTPTMSGTSLVVVHHAKLHGADIYSGMLPNINACSDISSGISASGQNPAHIIVLLTASNTEIPCAATPLATTQDFSVSFQSTDTKAPVLNGVSINGTAVPYTLVEEN